MLDRDLIIFDVETSGKDPKTCSIIQLGAVRFLKTGRLTSECFSIFVKPYTDIWEEEAEGIHKIKKEFLDVKGFGIYFALIQFERWIKKLGYDFKDIYLAMWSNGFDTECLKEAYKNALVDMFPFHYRSFDIASFTRLYLAGYGMLPQKKQSLIRCCNVLNIDTVKPLHNALNDAVNAGKILGYLYNKIRLSRVKNEKRM